MKLGINGRFYGASRVTGIQRFAREVAARLYERADCVLLLPRGVGRPDGVPAGVATMTGRLAGHVWEQVELPHALRRAHCDVSVHLASTAPVRGGPYVMTVHDVTPLTNPEWFRRRFAWWYRLALRTAARRAARVCTVSEWARDEAARVLGLPAARIGVVTPGLAPFDTPAPPDAVRAVRDRYGLSDPYLLTTGGGDPRKNIEFLVDLVRDWEPSSQAPVLVITGEGNRRVHPDRRAGREPPGVRRLGFVSDDEMRALYTGAAVFCYPSLSEGFGRPPWEALACGTPVVTADYGPARELLEGVATILPLESERWQAEIEATVGNAELRAETAQRGREAAARFGWPQCAEEVLRFCREALPERDAA